MCRFSIKKQKKKRRKKAQNLIHIYTLFIYITHVISALCLLAFCAYQKEMMFTTIMHPTTRKRGLMMSIGRSCCSCFETAAEENRFRSLCTSSSASASATASTDDDKDDDENRRRIRERERDEEECIIEENPNENAWRRMVREADEFVLPPALRLKTLASSRVEDDGNKTKNIESSLSSLI
jgi:hypothetical protein